MEKQATLEIHRIISDLLMIGRFPGEVAVALAQSQQYVAAVIEKLSEPDPAPKKKTTRKKKVSK